LVKDVNFVTGRPLAVTKRLIRGLVTTDCTARLRPQPKR